MTAVNFFMIDPVNCADLMVDCVFLYISFYG